MSTLGSTTSKIIQLMFGSLLSRTRIGKFASVGVVGAALETIIVAAFTTVGGFGPLVAKAVGAEISISVMFAINDRWTFATEGQDGRGELIRRWLRSHLVRLVGLSVAFVTLYILTTSVAISIIIYGFDFWPVTANIVGIGAGLILNYVAESLFTWQVANSGAEINV